MICCVSIATQCRHERDYVKSLSAEQPCSALQGGGQCLSRSRAVFDASLSRSSSCRFDSGRSFVPTPKSRAVAAVLPPHAVQPFPRSPSRPASTSPSRHAGCGVGRPLRGREEPRGKREGTAPTWQPPSPWPQPEVPRRCAGEAGFPVGCPMAVRSSGRQPGSGTGGGAVIAQRVPPRVRSGRAAPLSARRSASGPAGLLEGLRPRRPCPRHWGVPELPARGPGKVRDEETGENGKVSAAWLHRQLH